ncbi:MAG: hypothetical protein JAZ05_14065 [Candidatus Thiodiazotropha taylori]|nr:hypothetical protein [Candidatus Thiodiazotropha taylori]MCW4293140.1 hypothetical protein [Candidatus Thiodiazotropha taylori]
MGQSSDKDGSVFPNLCIYLFDQDDQRQNYLQHILSFVEGDVVVVDDISQIELSDQSRYTCVSVMVGAGEGRDKQLAVVKDLAESHPYLPVFQIYDEQEGAPQLFEGMENVIGSFRLPTLYDDLMALAHKAQVFQELKNPEAGSSRPVELFRSLSGIIFFFFLVNKMI